MKPTQSTRSTIHLTALCVALFAAYPAAGWAGVAGRAQFVAGDVRLVDAQGKDQPLRKGQDVNEGDTVLSAEGASAQLKMIDGAIIAVRPGTQLKLVGYQFNGKEDGTEKASFSLVKGGLRAITGAIGRSNKDRYRIDTPTATIGIRGTDHEPMVVLPSPNGNAGGPAPGTYDKVNVGATALTTQAGTMLVAANQVGFAASPNQAPVILPVVPEFYRNSAAPAAQTQKQEKKEAQQAARAPAAADNGGTADNAGADGPAASAPTSAPDAPRIVAMTAITAPLAPPPSRPLTAVDTGGNLLDLARQTLTTRDGTSLPVGEAPPAPTPAPAPSPAPVPTPPAKTGVELLAGYPMPVNAVETTGPTEPDYRYPAMFYFQGPADALKRDAAGNLVRVDTVMAQEDMYQYHTTLSQSGSAMAELGRHDATGLSWGRWQGGTVNTAYQYYGRDASGAWGLGAEDDNGIFVIGNSYTYAGDLGSGSLHWVAGPSAGPHFLPQVLTGSALYTSVGGTRPTDTKGNIGTFRQATLGVNFTTQTADASVDFTIAGDSWNMKSGNMILQGNHFSSYGNCAVECPSAVQLIKNGSVLNDSTGTGSGAYGSVNGMLTGQGLNGAALQYAIQTHAPKPGTDPNTGLPYYEIDHNLIQGVAALAGPMQNVDTPFRVVAFGSDWMSDYDDELDLIAPDGTPLYRGSIEGEASPAARVVDDATGLREFVGSAFGYTPVGGTTTTAGTIAGDYRAMRATIKAGTAVNRDVGSTTIAGATISWGRWEGGTVDIYSGDGSTKLGTINNSQRSMHWLTSSVLNSQYFSMPLTGTATYTVAGNTRPTDLTGNVGKLDSATLKADFANAKVDASVSVSFNSTSNTSNWTMQAANVPLAGNGDFRSGSALNGVNGITHSVSCTGASCGTQASGYLDGHIIGGGQGAVMGYNMTTGTPGTGAVLNGASGLVVMKK